MQRYAPVVRLPEKETEASPGSALSHASSATPPFPTCLVVVKAPCFPPVNELPSSYHNREHLLQLHRGSTFNKAYSHCVQATFNLWRTRNRAVAITTNITPSTISASEGRVDRKSARSVPTISKDALLRMKMRSRVAIPNRSKASDSPIRTSVGVRLLSLTLNQSAGKRSKAAPDNAAICPTQCRPGSVSSRMRNAAMT